MKPNLFNSIKLIRPKNNVFDLTHDVKLSCNMGQLVPIMMQEAVPGDRFNIGCESLIRFSPLVAPVMHRMDVTMHYFFVPNRILWDKWEDYITNTKSGGVLPAAPFLKVQLGSYGKLSDYFGIPTPLIGFEEKVSALPYAAYQKIYNEYYRDENLISPVVDTCGDGENSQAVLDVLRNRCWEHDYFTASLPFAQKGEAVDIPLGKVMLDPDNFDYGRVLKASDHSQDPGDLKANALTSALAVDNGTTTDDAVYDPNGTLITEPTTINDLRRAFRLQEWLERMARGGSRYIEVILAHFGVRSSDKRLQRPEYIVGVKNPVVISEVLNTTGTDDLPQGNMSGHALSVVQGHAGNYFCEEHGWIVGIMSIMPKTAYQQGIPRQFTKYNDPTEYFWDSFANIGEQEVKNKEVYAFQTLSEETFGYVPRYAEYKYAPSRVAGDFKTSLDFWHLGRKFASAPSLNELFVKCDPTYRVFAVTDPDVDHLYCHVLNKVKAIRPMPKFGTPHI